MVFITFDGIDGVGKTTQIKKLYKNLKDKGLNVCCTREPGGCSFSEKIRNFLKTTIVKNETEVLLQIASRIEHVNKLIRPALQSNNIVLCDRYVDSTIAYQCFSGALTRDKNNAVISDFLYELVCDKNILDETKYLLKMAIYIESIDGGFLNFNEKKEITTCSQPNSDCTKLCNEITNFIIKHFPKIVEYNIFFQNIKDFFITQVVMLNFVLNTHKYFVDLDPNLTILLDVLDKDKHINSMFKLNNLDKYESRSKMFQFWLTVGYHWLYHVEKEKRGKLFGGDPRIFHKIARENIDSVSSKILDIVNGYLDFNKCKL